MVAVLTKVLLAGFGSASIPPMVTKLVAIPVLVGVEVKITVNVEPPAMVPRLHVIKFPAALLEVPEGRMMLWKDRFAESRFDKTTE